MIIKIVSAGIICALLCVIVRQYRSDFAVIIQIAGIAVIFFLAVSFISELKEQVAGLSGISLLIEDGYIKILVKALSIAVITRLCTDICDDTGNSALASSVDLIGKIIILSMCMPLMKILVEIAEGLLA